MIRIYQGYTKDICYKLHGKEKVLKQMGGNKSPTQNEEEMNHLRALLNLTSNPLGSCALTMKAFKRQLITTVNRYHVPIVGFDNVQLQSSLSPHNFFVLIVLYYLQHIKIGHNTNKGELPSNQQFSKIIMQYFLLVIINVLFLLTLFTLGLSDNGTKYLNLKLSKILKIMREVVLTTIYLINRLLIHILNGISLIKHILSFFPSSPLMLSLLSHDFGYVVFFPFSQSTSWENPTEEVTYDMPITLRKGK
ncbi:hypothetical protein CR513_59699, partial [Mucuna pruriens]